MATIWDWWNNNVVKKYTTAPHLVPYFSEPYITGYYYPIPTIVNVDTMCNAFYTPDIDGYGDPGFAFGGENACASGSEDLVIDSDVVRHEYTHAMMDWLGFDVQFGGPVNYYGRAMGEGNADWFAFLNTPKDPLMADVAWAWSSNGYLRDLDNVQMYPYSVDLTDYPSAGQNMPEEHYTGEIWGGYLYDLYRVLGSSALKYVYQSFYYFDPSLGWMDSGNPYVGTEPDFFDAIYAQMLAEYELTGKQTQSFKAWGSMVSRGISGWFQQYCNNPYFGTGAYGCDTPWGLFWSFPPYKTISTKGNLLVTGDPHDYVINAQSGTPLLTVTVTGTSKGMISPTINLYTSGGAYVTQGVTIGNKATLKYYNLPAGLYVVRVSGTMTSPARGYYNFTVSLK